MKIKAYDKYHKKWIQIQSVDDEIWDFSSSDNKGVVKNIPLLFSILEGDKDSCDPSRWSDFEQFEIVTDEKNV